MVIPHFLGLDPIQEVIQGVTCHVLEGFLAGIQGQHTLDTLALTGLNGLEEVRVPVKEGWPYEPVKVPWRIFPKPTYQEERKDK